MFKKPTAKRQEYKDDLKVVSVLDNTELKNLKARVEARLREMEGKGKARIYRKRTEIQDFY
jgi:hypothetical protein